MILVGLDDTDVIDHPGTNQLARHIASALDGEFHCCMIVRHQLLFDPRIPYTSKNGSASMWLEPRSEMPMAMLADRLRRLIADWAPAGSDPGFCVAESVPTEVREFGRACQQQIKTQEEARALAGRHGLLLEGVGGTEGGVIGALAAVGLTAERKSGRIVHLSPAPLDFYDVTGQMSVAELKRHGIEVVLNYHTEEEIDEGEIQLGKRLRPNLSAGRIVLYVEPTFSDEPAVMRWQVVRVV